MTRPTADEIRAEPAGRRLDAWVCAVVFGDGNYHELRTNFSIDAPTQWRHRNTGDVMPYYSTDPAACAELRRHLWASGRYWRMDSQVMRFRKMDNSDDESFIDCTLEERYGDDDWNAIEPVGTDPIAAECTAWCKVALLASAV